MSKNIFVMYRNSSRIIPGRSILNNSNHQSSNIEGKRRNLCTIFSSPSFLFSFSQARHAYTHVYCPRLSTWDRFWPQFDHQFPCSDPFVSNQFSRFHTSGGPWSSTSGVRAFIPSIPLSIPSCTSSISSLSKSGYFLFHKGFLFESFEVHDDWLGNSERG